jgi:hypothetical protein
MFANLAMLSFYALVAQEYFSNAFEKHKHPKIENVAILNFLLLPKYIKNKHPYCLTRRKRSAFGIALFFG